MLGWFSGGFYFATPMLSLGLALDDDIFLYPHVHEERPCPCFTARIFLMLALARTDPVTSAVVP